VAVGERIEAADVENAIVDEDQLLVHLTEEDQLDTKLPQSPMRRCIERPHVRVVDVC